MIQKNDHEKIDRDMNTHGKIRDNTHTKSSDGSKEKKNEIDSWIFDFPSRIIANEFRSKAKQRSIFFFRDVRSFTFDDDGDRQL